MCIVCRHVTSPLPWQVAHCLSSQVHSYSASHTLSSVPLVCDDEASPPSLDIASSPRDSAGRKRDKQISAGAAIGTTDPAGTKLGATSGRASVAAGEDSRGAAAASKGRGGN